MNEYYNGWPHSGKYVDKLNKIWYLLYNYLINFPKTGKKYSVIFDIDDTLVYTHSANKNYPNNIIKGYMIFPEIKQIVDIAKLCKHLGFEIIIITGRPYESEQSSIKNLEILGIDYDSIYHNHNYPDVDFKIYFKQELAKERNIILSVGDQWTDLEGLVGCLCIKLPSLNDKNAYFTYDNKKYYIIV